MPRLTVHRELVVASRAQNAGRRQRSTPIRRSDVRRQSFSTSASPRTVLTDSIKQLITLGSAALTLSVAFVKDIAGGHLAGWPKICLQLSWVALFFSLIFGIAALFTIVTQNRSDIAMLRNPWLRALVGLQQLTFLLSFAGLVAVAWVSVK
jgi:hypothetical protein